MMNNFLLAVLLRHFIPVIALGKIENDDKEVDVIYSPYEIGGDNNNCAALSVDLKDLNKFTVCFAFMVDGLVDVAYNAADVATSPDIVTFWFMLASISINVEFDSLSIEDGSFAPYKWIRTCFSIDFVKGNATLVANGNEISKAKVDLTTKPKLFNMTLEKTLLSISVTNLNIFSILNSCPWN